VLRSSGGRDKCIGISRRDCSQTIGPRLDELHSFEVVQWCGAVVRSIFPSSER
jgi:hypothetical protein